MFKFNKLKNNGALEIINAKTEEVIAQVRMDYNKSNKKNLCVLDEVICTVTTREEALTKLQSFFQGNRAQMLSNCIVIDELTRDLKVVKSEYAHKLISNDIVRLERNNRQLERFNELV